MDNSDRRTIEECVRSHASVMPEKTAVVCDGRTLSYARLWEEALRKRDELIGEGLAPGRLHIFRVSQDEDFIATYLAVHMAGAVAVPLEGTARRPASATSSPATATSSCHVTRTEWRR